MTKKKLSLNEYAEIVESIYDAAMQPKHWVACLNSIRELLDANFATLIIRPVNHSDPGLMVNAGLDSDHGGGFVTALEWYSNLNSPFVNLPVGKIFTVNDLMSEATWKESDYYKQWCEPRGVHHVMGIDLETKDRSGYKLRVTRSIGREMFHQDAKDICSMLIPHLSKALYIQSKLDTSEQLKQLYSQAIGSLSVGTVTVDQNGRIMSSNTIAQALLQTSDGLKNSGGRLHAVNATENKELTKIINDALSPKEDLKNSSGVWAMSISRAMGHQSLGVIIQKLPIQSWSGSKNQPSLVIFIRDPEIKTQAPAKITQQLFHFTPAEATLAIELANGLSLDEAAELLNIRRNTARAHLRSIFAKTGVRRQTELVRLLLNSVVALGQTSTPMDTFDIDI